MKTSHVAASTVRACARGLANGRLRLPEEMKAVARELGWAAELSERERHVRRWRGISDGGRPGAEAGADTGLEGQPQPRRRA